MAIRASTVTPSEAYPRFKAEVIRVRNYAAQISARLSSNISAEDLPRVLQQFVLFKNSLTSLIVSVDNAEFIAYAQSQESDGLYDPAAEWITFRGLIDAVIAEIQATPTNSLITGWTTDGIVWNTFTPAQTSALKADVDAIVSGIS